MRHRTELDSSRLRRIIKGYYRCRLEESANGTPTCKIPFVASLVPIFIKCATNHFGYDRARILIAAMYLASHTGLRPSEWSPQYSLTTQKPIALAINTYFGNTKQDKWARLDELATTLVTEINCLLILLTSKADPSGKAPARTLSKRPGGPWPQDQCAFESVRRILTEFPPIQAQGAGILSGVPHASKVQGQVRYVLSLVADEIGVDRRRLVLHSFRLLILSQLMAADVDTGTIRLIVGWKSEQGMKPYYRSFVKKTSTFADALHDTSAISPGQLVILNTNIALPTANK